MKRRRFLQSAAAGLLTPAFAPLSGAFAAAPVRVPKGKAEHVVMIWLGGGMAQMDTLDPKALGDPKANKPGAYYPSIPTAAPGVRVCEHFPRLAGFMDRATAVRTVHHDVIDEHAAATNRMHTGRAVNGSIVYPSLGSIIAHEKGALDDGAPAYVSMGYPSPSRGPGFLGAKAGYLSLIDTATGPAGLQRPADITDARASRRASLLQQLRDSGRERFQSDKSYQDYDAALEASLKLSSGDFMRAFDLKQEPASLRGDYGSEFGQRLLLSRRLIQRGVRFLEVSQNLNFLNGTGWDTHLKGQLNQHLLIRDLDQALAAFLADLERNGLLEKTLVLTNTEFGRPAAFDSGGGRGHHGKCFSLLLAGGGLNHQGAYGVTNETAEKIVEHPVSVPDFFATVCCAVGIDPSKNLDGGERPVPVTDGGRAIAPLFS